MVTALLAAFLGLPGLPAPVPPVWSFSPHQVICEVAWQRLTPAGKELVRTVRQADTTGSRTFAESCVWADQVRDSTHHDTYEYHFINVNRGSARVDWKRDCAAYDCVAVAVVRYANYLSQEPRGNRDRLRRAEALKFLGHFVGDLHQPLHAGYADDLGGNTTMVTWEGRQMRLHSVWDGQIPRRAGITGVESASQIAASITDRQAAEWLNADVFKWVEESYQLVRNVVYDYQAGEELSGPYASKAVPVVNEQIRKAGVRLAGLINSIAAGSLQLPELPGN